jgi:uncharacterized protein
VLVLIVVGLLAGTLGSIIGVGGGLIMTPALTVMGFAPAQISSTSLFAVTFASASSTISYVRQKRIQYHVGVKAAAVAIPGAITGAFISSALTIESFKLYFGSLLLLAGIYIAYSGSLKEKQNRPTMNDNKLELLPLFYTGGIWCGYYLKSFWSRRRDSVCSTYGSRRGHVTKHC